MVAFPSFPQQHHEFDLDTASFLDVLHGEGNFAPPHPQQAGVETTSPTVYPEVEVGVTLCLPTSAAAGTTAVDVAPVAVADVTVATPFPTLQLDGNGDVVPFAAEAGYNTPAVGAVGYHPQMGQQEQHITTPANVAGNAPNSHTASSTNSDEEELSSGERRRNPALGNGAPPSQFRSLKEKKKWDRIMKNRRSAAASRERKKSQVSQLEKKCQSFDKERSKFMSIISSLESENKVLKNEVSFLRDMIAMKQGVAKPKHNDQHAKGCTQSHSDAVGIQARV